MRRSCVVVFLQGVSVAVTVLYNVTPSLPRWLSAGNTRVGGTNTLQDTKLCKIFFKRKLGRTLNNLISVGYPIILLFVFLFWFINKWLL